MSGMDIAVLGGGPAGLAAALALRQRGFRVALYDGQRPPIDKACGEGLMPAAVRLLRELGVSLDSSDGARLEGIRFHDARATAAAAFGAEQGLAMRRTRLQGRMTERAAEMGVVLRWGAVVRAVAGGGFASADEAIHADYFVIADGLCSTLAKASGFRERYCYSTRYASRQQFQCAPWSDRVEVHWGRHEQLYVTPLGCDEVGVALLTSARGRRLCDALPDFPAVAKRIAGVTCTSSMRGAVTKTRSLRKVIHGNVVVLGDASGSVDAVTGEGLLSAFRQAHALAGAIAAGDLKDYAVAHRQISRGPERMARLLLQLDRLPWLERRFVATMARRPESFRALLRVHLAEESWLSFAANEVPELLRIPDLLRSRRERSHWWPFTAGAYRERGL